MDVVDNVELDVVDNVELDVMDNVELDVMDNVELVDDAYSFYHGLVVSYYGASYHYHMASCHHMAFYHGVVCYDLWASEDASEVAWY